MSFALLALASFVAGVATCYTIMRRDDDPSEELVKAKAEAKKVVEEAEASLERDLIPIKQAQAKLDVVKKMKNPEKQLDALADFINRERPSP